MKKTLILIIILLVSFSCKKETKQPETIAKSYDKIEQLQWLVGNWTNITKTEQSYENWTQINDSTLKAHSFTIVKNDTVFAERVTLQQQKDDVSFTVIAYRQNDDKPVTFMLNSTQNNVFTFENPMHDFPTKIHYSNPVKDSIHAWIEGKVKGEPRKIDFYFKRKK